MTRRENPATPLTFTAGPLDRAALLRLDQARIQAFLAGGRARIVPVWNQRHPLTDDARPHLMTYEEARRITDLGAAPFVFLGLEGEEPWFALGLPGEEAPPEVGPENRFAHLTEVVSTLPADEAAVLAYARAMVIWHFNHMHCGRCGAPTASGESGHSRACTDTACGHRSFPRTDPAVITLVTDGERCLLGRQPRWPAGMYSTIAGFVEPGETLEETVRREVREETGVEVGAVRYQASQPWPFPSSIMLGFRAEAVSTAIRRDDDELEDVRWFTRDELDSFGEMHADGTGFKLPGPYSIARFLIEDWRLERR